METQIKKFALETVSQSPRRWTSQALRKKLAATFAMPPRQAGAIIGDLVAAGDLAYTYHLGHSFLELSFNRPVCVAHGVVLKPPSITYAPKPEEVVIDIQPGAAFGVGTHPSTQLAIRGIEHAMQAKNGCRSGAGTSVLDIGTGSGVLAITAVKMGIEQGLATDIDPCARVEALENIRLNRLTGCITVRDQAIATLAGGYSLILANLRYPTLMHLLGLVENMLEEKGVVVVSGFTLDERPHLQACCRANRLASIWQAADRRWAAMVLKKAPAG